MAAINRKLSYKVGREETDIFTGYNNRLAAFLETLTVDTDGDMEEFHGPTGVALPSNKWLTFSGGGAGAAAGVFNSQAGGAARFVTGTANGSTSVSMLGRSLDWFGQLYAIAEFRVKIGAAVTNSKMELMLIDTVPVNGTTVPPDTGAVNSLAAATWNLTGDGVGWCYDTSNDANWHFLGIAGGVATLLKTPSQSAQAGGATAFTPVASTYETLGIMLLDGVAIPYHKSTAGRVDLFGLTGIGDGLAAAVTKTVGLTPWAFVQARSATTKTMDLDYVRVWQHRTIF